jgi:hypothetical protein
MPVNIEQEEGGYRKLLLSFFIRAKKRYILYKSSMPPDLY